MSCTRVHRLARHTAALIVLLLGTTRCSDQPPAPRISADGVATSAPGARGAPADTPASLARARLAMARGAWAGALHRRAMEALIADSAVRRGTRTAARRCAIAWTLAARYRSIIDARVGPAAQAQWRSMPADLEIRVGCPRGSAAGLRAASSGALPLLATEDSVLPSGVTGEYERYTPDLERIYGYATHPSEVESGSRRVINRAAAEGLPQPELDYLALIAGISISSAYQWYEFEIAGGFGGSGSTDQPATASLADTMPRWGKIGWADLGGAITGSRGGLAWAIVGTLVASGVMAMNSM